MAAVSSRPPTARRSRRRRRSARGAEPDAPPWVPYRPSYRWRVLRSLRLLVVRLGALGLLAACLWGVVTWGLAPLLEGSHAPRTKTVAPPLTAPVRQVLPPANLVPGLTRSRVHGLPLSVLDASGHGRLAAVVVNLRALGFGRARTVVSSATIGQTLIAYAPGWRRRAEAASQALGLPLRPRGTWLGPLQHAKLVLVLGRK